MFVCVFRSLSQTEQWRCLVSELIAVCYRMSDVVSPVVQSSSPEGLIPMDTDSGNQNTQPGHKNAECTDILILNLTLYSVAPFIHMFQVEHFFFFYNCLSEFDECHLFVSGCDLIISIINHRDVSRSAEDPAGDSAQGHQ